MTLSPSMTDPRELRAILALIREGFEPEEVCRLLHFSMATYYRRKAEIERIRQEAKKLGETEE